MNNVNKHQGHLATIKYNGIHRKAFPLVLLTITVLVCMTALQNGRSIMDSWQSIGPCVDSSPGRLHAFLGTEFAGLDRVWGHHWFGYPWIRSLFIEVFPYGRQREMLIIGAFAFLNSFIIFKFLSNQKQPLISAMLAPCAYLAYPDTFSSLADLRPEPAGGFLVLALALVAASTIPERPIMINLRRLTLCLLTFLSPIISPATMFAGIGISICLVVTDGLRRRNERRNDAFMAFASNLLGIIFGIIYYVSEPDRLLQFRENILGQKEANLSILSAAQSAWLGPIATLSLFLYVVPVLIIAKDGVSIFRYQQSFFDKSFNFMPLNRLRFLLAAGIVSYLLASSILANPNRIHFVTLLPAAFILLGTMASSAPRKSFQSQCRWLIAPVALAAFLLTGPRILRAAIWPGNSIRDQECRLLERYSTGDRHVVIPFNLWEAAAETNHGQYLFNTFPNFCRSEFRRGFEDSVLARLKIGDIYIIREGAYVGGYFPKDSFPNPQSFDIQANGDFIEKIDICSQKSSQYLKPWMEAQARHYNIFKIVSLPEGESPANNQKNTNDRK